MSANIRLVLMLAGLAGLVACIWTVSDLVASGRVTKATETFNQENRNAADKGADARASVRACRERGGMSWDRSSGQCVRTVQGTGQ